MYATKCMFAWYFVTSFFPHYFSTSRRKVLHRDLPPQGRVRGVRRMSTPSVNRTEPGRWIGSDTGSSAFSRSASRTSYFCCSGCRHWTLQLAIGLPRGASCALGGPHRGEKKKQADQKFNHHKLRRRWCAPTLGNPFPQNDETGRKCLVVMENPTSPLAGEDPVGRLRRRSRWRLPDPEPRCPARRWAGWGPGAPLSLGCTSGV